MSERMVVGLMRQKQGEDSYGVSLLPIISEPVVHPDLRKGPVSYT